MPATDRAAGRQRSRRNGNSSHVGWVWAKWGAILTAASVASFFVSYYWIAPRVQKPVQAESDGAKAPVAAPTVAQESPAERAPRPAGPDNATQLAERASKSAGGGGDGSSSPGVPAVKGDTAGQGNVTIRPAGEAKVSPSGGESPGASEVAAPVAVTAPVDGTAPAAAAPSQASQAGVSENTATAREGPLFRVEVGAPATRTEAESLVESLAKHGFPARVVVEGSIFHVQAGAFRSRQNAERLAAALGNKGYAATIAGGVQE